MAGGSQRGGRTQGGQLPQHRQTAADPGPRRLELQGSRPTAPPAAGPLAAHVLVREGGLGRGGPCVHVPALPGGLGRGRGRDRGHPPGETDSEEMEHFCLIGFLPWLARKQPTFNSSSRNYSKR